MYVCVYIGIIDIPIHVHVHVPYFCFDDVQVRCTVLVIIKLTKFAVAVRLWCGSVAVAVN